MAQRDREDVRRSLCSKGFVEENNDHYFYVYVYNSKRTSIFTKISKGSKYKTLQRPLLSLMSKQLKLTFSQFVDFVDCTFTAENYLAHLEEKKLIK